MAITNYITTHGRIRGDSTNGLITRYGTDAVGSVVATYSNNNIGNTYRYKPYGGVLQSTGSLPNPNFMFLGSLGYFESGLSYSDLDTGPSYYSTSFGAFLSASASFTEGSPYAFPGGNPANGPLGPGAGGPCGPNTPECNLPIDGILCKFADDEIATAIAQLLISLKGNIAACQCLLELKGRFILTLNSACVTKTGKACSLEPGTCKITKPRSVDCENVHAKVSKQCTSMTGCYNPCGSPSAFKHIKLVMNMPSTFSFTSKKAGCTFNITGISGILKLIGTVSDATCLQQTTTIGSTQ